MLDNNITKCPRRFEWVGDKMPKWEPAADRGLWTLSDPWLSNPAKIRKKYCWVNIAVRPCLHSPLTHKKHHPFENKACEIYFYKEVYSLIYWSCHYRLMMFPLVFVLWIYNISSLEANLATRVQVLNEVWFSSVLWHIIYCRLFNPKYSLYIYIEYTWFLNSYCR